MYPSWETITHSRPLFPSFWPVSHEGFHCIGPVVRSGKFQMCREESGIFCFIFVCWKCRYITAQKDDVKNSWLKDYRGIDKTPECYTFTLNIIVCSILEKLTFHYESVGSKLFAEWTDYTYNTTRMAAKGLPFEQVWLLSQSPCLDA